MRPSPRLSLFAACCAAVMLACTAEAVDHPYSFAVTGSGTADGASEVDGWIFHSIGVSHGYAYFNAKGDYIELSDTFSTPITNIQVSYMASTAEATRLLYIHGYNTTTGDGPADRGFPASTSRTTENFPFDQSDDVNHIEIKLDGSGSKGYWTLYSVTIQTVDPPPTIDSIDDLEASAASDLVVHFVVTSSDGDDPPTFSATAENLDDPNATYSSDRFNFSPNYSAMRPGYYDFTFSPPEGFEPCSMRFTITATGRGGSASQSFVCTFIDGTLPTPPQVWTPTFNPAFVLARRTITLQVNYVEADGDQVTFTVTNATPCNGPYSIGASTGIFTFTPTLLDVSEYPHEFTARATDKDGYNEASIRIVVVPVGTPKLTPIDDCTMAFGETLWIDLEAEATEYVQADPVDDPLLSSNITVKVGTTAPEGEYIFEDGYLAFTPTTNDIGQTFIFTASATDFDGTTNQDFNVTVGLAKPVLKHCPVDDWTDTSFTADIEAAVPGATSYRLRHIHYEQDGTVVTGYVDNAAFPCVVSGLDTTNYVYAVQAQRGATVSSWSNAKSIDLHNYLAPTYAIPMTGGGRGIYRQDFNNLITSGSIYWYDARTISGWYAASSSGSMSDEKLTASKGVSSETGLLSCQVDTNNIPDRALGLRAATQWDDFSFGVVFTNTCRYAVTNLSVTFTALQIRRYNTISHLWFSYARSNGFIELTTPGLTWTDVDDLSFSSPVQGSSAQLYPPETRRLSAAIPFEGASAIQPGEVIAMRWYLEAKANYPTLAIDDLEVKWQCAWPRQTVIYLQ